MRDATKGVLLGGVAAAVWGSTYVAMRLVYRLSDVDPVWVALVRFMVGGLALTVAIALSGQARRLALFVRDPIPFFWLGLTGVASLGILGAIASALTAAANVSLILNANPVFVALLAPLIGERLTARRLAGVAIGLLGVAVVALGAGLARPTLAGGHGLVGIVAAAGAAVSWALYTLLGKEAVRRYGGLLTATLSMLWGDLILLAVAAVSPVPRHVPAPAVALLIYLGLIPSAFAFAIWYRALTLADAAAVAPTQYTAPICTAMLAWLILGEAITPPFFIALALVFIGIALAARA